MLFNEYAMLSTYQIAAISAFPIAFLAWAVRRWWRTSPRIGTPAWRSYTAIAAVSMAGVSVLVWIVIPIWAHAIGGFPYYDPVLMRLYAVGFLTASVGFLPSFAGKGKLRWPAFFLSLTMDVLW